MRYGTGKRKMQTIRGLPGLLCAALAGAWVFLCPNLLIASGAGEAGHGAAPFGKEMIFQIINFALLVLLLLYVYRKFSAGDGGFKKRSLDVQMAMEEAAREKKKAEEKYREYQARIARLDDEVNKILERAREDAAREREAILAEARLQAEKFSKQAEFTSRQEIEQAKRDLRREAADLAAEIAAEILRKALTPEDQKNWIKLYTEKIGDLS